MVRDWRFWLSVILSAIASAIGGVAFSSEPRRASAAAVRVVAGSACGSGSVVGGSDGAWFVLSNAHVTGTRVGREVVVRFAVGAGFREERGPVVMAAYSDRTLTDWSIVRVSDIHGRSVVPMAKRPPSGMHYTTGSPRCIWPQVSSTLTTADVSDTSTLWRWRPNAIGGQSGSGVWSVRDDLCYGLLTWSWGGLGAGQQTAVIWRQASTRSVDGPPRIDGLQELCARDPDTVVEVGFFAEASIVDLPIWAPDGDVAPPSDNLLPLSENERELLRVLRLRFNDPSR